MPVRLESITPDAENIIAYCARVSNPKNQDNPQIAKLLAYCVANKHWSIFEMANMVLEIRTTRAIAAQILRHRSFSFQEFSQRYAEALTYQPCGARRQDTKNRQNSIDDLPPDVQKWWSEIQDEVWHRNYLIYKAALDLGIAKEVARMVLPLNTETVLFMNGTIRSWIHYIQLRTDPSAQKEHRDIADGCKAIFVQQLPIISEALGWI